MPVSARGSGDRLAVDHHAALAHRQQPADQPQQCRFPATRGADKADELVAADRDRDVAERRDPIAVARDEVLGNVLDLDHADWLTSRRDEVSIACL